VSIVGVIAIDKTSKTSTDNTEKYYRLSFNKSQVTSARNYRIGACVHHAFHQGKDCSMHPL